RIAHSIARRRPARTASSCSGATSRARCGSRRRRSTMDRKSAERKVGFAKLWARAKQVLTTDPSGSDEDDRVVDEEAARVLAAQAGKLKGGLAKVAQLAGYWDHRGTTPLATLWDKAPAMPATEIAKVIEHDLGKPPQQLFASWDITPI